MLCLGGVLSAQGATLPEVKERRLGNGIRVLMLERPTRGVLHAALFLRGGQADTGALPPVAAELLARSLFGTPLPEDVNGGSLDALLKAEEGASEALRIENIQQGRNAGAPGSEVPELVALVQSSRQELERRLAAASDPFLALGGVHRWIEAKADFLATGLDLPVESLEGWARLEFQRIQKLQLGRFPMERQRLAGAVLGSEGDAVLLGAAFPGHPYSQVGSRMRAALDALTWTELRTFGRWALNPERLSLVLVGDLEPEAAIRLLEATFGRLGSAGEDPGRREAYLGELPEAPGARRLQAATREEQRLYVAWRIPPGSHPASPGLRVLAQVLGGSQGRLARRLMGAVPLARRLELRMGVPGERDANLLVVEAEPVPGRSLAELEQTVRGEVLRLQREPLSDGEIRSAQRQLEGLSLRDQEDSAVLARSLGQGQAQCGDWRLSFRSSALGRNFSQEEIQDLARRFLVPTQSITVLLEPDPLTNPTDGLETQLAGLLQELVRQRVEDPGEAEVIVRDTLRQLRTLNRTEREQTLKLLERQVRP